jgi:hypothetical protein
MTKVPKAYINTSYTFAVRPTEEQLLSYYKDFGYDNIEAILDGQGSWEKVIRDWFVNTNFNQDYKDYQTINNIFGYEGDEIEDVSIVSDTRWEDDENCIF